MSIEAVVPTNPDPVRDATTTTTNPAISTASMMARATTIGISTDDWQEKVNWEGEELHEWASERYSVILEVQRPNMIFRFGVPRTHNNKHEAAAAFFQIEQKETGEEGDGGRPNYATGSLRANCFPAWLLPCYERGLQRPRKCGVEDRI